MWRERQKLVMELIPITGCHCRLEPGPQGLPWWGLAEDTRAELMPTTSIIFKIACNIVFYGGEYSDSEIFLCLNRFLNLAVWFQYRSGAINRLPFDVQIGTTHL